jgi:hypothetical protein
MPLDTPPVRQLGRVRRVFWALLAASLLLALAVPLTYLWRETSAALVARACVLPSTPRLGAPAQVLVTLPNASDRAAVQGPWARVVAEWDMVTMSMGARRTAVAGPPASAHDPTIFAVPLHLDMAGLWSARITLTTPGRPTWQTAVQFSVAPAGASAQPSASPAPPESPGAVHPIAGCGPGA